VTICHRPVVTIVCNRNFLITFPAALEAGMRTCSGSVSESVNAVEHVVFVYFIYFSLLLSSNRTFIESVTTFVLSLRYKCY
jgi:hypothetical protein